MRVIEWEGAPAIQGTVADITARKQAEAALRQADAELDQQVQERTAALTHTNAELRAEIAERRRAEAALRASEEYFRTVYEAAPIGMANVDAAGCTIQANRALQQMTGYDEVELLALDAFDLTHPDDLAESSRLFEDLVAGRRTQYGLEKRYRRKDGSWLWARLTASAVRDADGRFRHTISMVEDITARKQAEEQIRFQAHLLDQALAAVIATSPRRRVEAVPLRLAASSARTASWTRCMWKSSPKTEGSSFSLPDLPM